jgi:lipopolysaccharide export system permease protein
LVGILGTTVYNPIAVTLQATADALNSRVKADAHSAFETSSGPVWMRQAGGDHESIIGASESFDQGLGLTDVTAVVYDRNGEFIERIDADTARYSPGAWLLANATVTAPGETPKRLDSYSLPTLLGPEHVQQAFDNINGISFWGLPALIETADRAGIPSDRYRLRYNSLLAQPILLVAMVLIAAIVSLRFSRSKELGQMILAGIGVGFVLYVVTKIARDLGGAGMVPAPLAAWLPAIVATLIGTTVLLHLEDG